MTILQNDHLTKWTADKMTIWRMTIWQNDHLTKWPSGEWLYVKMTIWQNDHLTIWQNNHLSNDYLTKWPSDKITIWQNDHNIVSVLLKPTSLMSLLPQSKWTFAFSERLYLILVFTIPSKGALFHLTGKTKRRGRLSAVDLLIKVACFVKN